MKKNLHSKRKYSNIKVPDKQKDIIKKLTNNEQILIMEQDKGRGVVIMDRNKYTEKCLSFLGTTQFKKLTKDPTCSTERKVQNSLRKVKKHLPEKTYKKLYPTGSRPGQFYGLAKIHKLKEGQGIDDLPLRPIISNIGTATYQIAKHLASLLSPLSKSDFTVSSTNEIVETLKQTKVPDDCELVSFDVASLFTSVPLEYTIDITLRKIYNDKLINTEIPKKEMKELLLLCTKNVHFTFGDNIYQQLDGVAMGSPLGPVLAGIFMVELETTIVPTLTEYLLFWKRYVDDTLCFVKKGFRQHILTELNKFHTNITFTYEDETNNMISFLDVLLIKREDSIDLAVFRKETNTDLYINWDAFAPETWKTSTLRTLAKRAYKICTQDYLLEMELQHLKKVFIEINNFPSAVVKRIIKHVGREHQQQQPPNNNVELEETKIIQATLPYAGEKGEQVIKEMKKHIKRLKHHKFDTRLSFKAKRLASRFQLKDQVKKKHVHDVVYEIECPDCDSFYIGESGRRLEERFKDHNGRDKNSHILKHTMESGHNPIVMDNVKIINKNFANYYKRKVSEAIFIKKKKPPLNVQDISVPLKLLN